MFGYCFWFECFVENLGELNGNEVKLVKFCEIGNCGDGLVIFVDLLLNVFEMFGDFFWFWIGSVVEVIDWCFDDI